MAEKKKILIAATSGGHLTEAVSLLFGIPGLEFVIFTEQTLRKYGDVKMYMYHRPKNQILTMAKSFFKGGDHRCGVRNRRPSCRGLSVPENNVH